MRFSWVEYTSEYNAFADSCLDDEAKRFTGCDDGFEEFYNYWANKPDMKVGENFWSKIILDNGTPIGIIAVSLWDGLFTIMELMISPNKRKQGIGTAVISELLNHSKVILGYEIENAKAVIFPNNIASQRAFEKAGFKFESEHVDGDAWYYEFKK